MHGLGIGVPPSGPPVEISAATYEQMKVVARRVLRRWPPHLSPLSATLVTHETYERLVLQRTRWTGPSQVVGVAAVLMPRVVADLLRHRIRLKRRRVAIRISEDVAGHEPHVDGSIWIDELLQAFGKADPRAARIVRLRLEGASNQEIAAELRCSPRTVDREWSYARAWLARELLRLESDPISSPREGPAR